eukprot:TRINITY_DN569_c0_g3_i1.p1 TRINITY_DN569_c0_g3~~TRINITY_DN569_c0_g3_i1.p1  ORF type:complete len:622 (+),score=84.12 TRINITY_DN569_c0_g3_i1:160-2025(+)
MAFYPGAGPGGRGQLVVRETPQRMVFDGKRMRKPVIRKVVDPALPILNMLEQRYVTENLRYQSIIPTRNAIEEMMPPSAWLANPSTSVTTRFAHTSTNKVRCPINACKWTPEGRRLITGASSGELTLWNGTAFNFETILQAHDKAIRAMEWSHNGFWMVTADDEGVVKYWQSNMNNAKAMQAHKECIRDLSFSPSDTKFTTCSDDGTIKLWDFATCTEERQFTGHGWDVKCVSWHPSKGLIASGSKDNLTKLWDPRSGTNITTLHGHKNTVLALDWNANGNWLLSGSRDQMLKMFDIRTMKEQQAFRGHSREVTTLAWHPFHETMFASASFDGNIRFWDVADSEAIGEISQAHESSVWALDWHPVGHVLCSASNDHTTKFWARNRPGDAMSDKFNATNVTGLEASNFDFSETKRDGDGGNRFNDSARSYGGRGGGRGGRDGGGRGRGSNDRRGPPGTCYAFAKGECNRGDSCRFSHDLSGASVGTRDHGGGRGRGRDDRRDDRDHRPSRDDRGGRSSYGDRDQHRQPYQQEHQHQQHQQHQQQQQHHHHQQQQHPGQFHDAQHQQHQLAQPPPQQQYDPYQQQHPQQHHQQHAPPQHGAYPPQGAPPPHPQIGRASCRERV